MLSDDLEQIKNDIYKYNNVYSLTGEQSKEMLDKIIIEVKKQEALIKEMLNWIIDNDITICRLCKIVNPQHKECISCSDRDSMLQIIQKAKERLNEN